MRVYCRPGATSMERLEAYVASGLCSRPEVSRQVAELLAWSIDGDPSREMAIRNAFVGRCFEDPAEALGAARALLLLCGVAPECCRELTGRPREDYSRLLKGCFRPPAPASPAAYAAPSLLESYCHMGTGFARGVDLVFWAATGRPLIAHLRRALALLEQGA